MDSKKLTEAIRITNELKQLKDSVDLYNRGFISPRVLDETMFKRHEREILEDYQNRIKALEKEFEEL